jgi:predicted nuclease of predicted toxin-antitoxin system
MRILLDECIDPRYANLFVRHTCESVKSMGWLGMKNGELLRVAFVMFDIFVTSDRNLGFQQNLAGLALTVVVVRQERNDPRFAAVLVRRLEELADASPEPGLHWVD